jgi:ubiquinone/menaquinone biosynthesis C-methylase UbiE
MSGYEDYTRVSALYDETRKPIGVEIILGCLANGSRPLSELVLLDAGCGTGNYSRALISRVARIQAVDLNRGMLAKARAKLQTEALAGRIGFHQALIGALPLEDESVDGVMVNQVLHHLNDDPAARWPLVRNAVGEFGRVLRPGGVLMVNICSQQQITHGWWYLPLIPEAAEKMRRRHVPIEALQKIMGERDSIWAIVDEDQLEIVKSKIRALGEAGALEEFVRQNDAQRRHIGQFTFVCARKAKQ